MRWCVHRHGNLIDDSTISTAFGKDAFLVPTCPPCRVLATEGVAAECRNNVRQGSWLFDAGRIPMRHAHSRGVKMVLWTDLLGPMHRHSLLESRSQRISNPGGSYSAQATTPQAELFSMTGEVGVVAVDAMRSDRAQGNRLEDIEITSGPGLIRSGS